MKKLNLLYYNILNYNKNNLSFLRENFNLLELHSPLEDTKEILFKIDIILAPLGYELNKKKIDLCMNLKIIGSNTTGDSHIDVIYARKKGVKVFTLKNEHRFLNSITPTAELTWGLILNITRNIIPASMSVRNSIWNRKLFGGRSMLSRLTLGIVGFGRLGQKVGNIALSFGMKVIYFDPYVESNFPGIKKSKSLEKLLNKSDIITVHVPHNEKTQNLFNKRRFSYFKKDSYFINTSRGELLDEGALLNCLKNGSIAGAALDVLQSEFKDGFEGKLKDSKLYKYFLENDNLILTPHIGGSTYDAWYETEKFIIDKIFKYSTRENSNLDFKFLINKTWAFIPARGGSKSIPLKNIVKLNKRPLIEYSIDAALSCKKISKVVCSSDNEKILELCLKKKIDIQKRPSYLSKDNVPTKDVILYFLKKTIQEINALPEYLVLLEPTSPFVSKQNIVDALEVLSNDPSADSSQTVTRVSSNSHAYNQRYHNSNGSFFLFEKERLLFTNKQDKPMLYIHGNLRVLRVSSFLKNNSLFGTRSLPVIVSKIEAFDVDDIYDLNIAEGILKNRKSI